MVRGEKDTTTASLAKLAAVEGGTVISSAAHSLVLAAAAVNSHANAAREKATTARISAAVAAAGLSFDEIKVSLLPPMHLIPSTNLHSRLTPGGNDTR